MKTPLAIKLILLLVLAWRLILSNKKTTKLDSKEYENLNDLPNIQIEKPANTNQSVKDVITFYRKVSRLNQNASKNYFLTYLVDKLDKIYSKGGIFRLFWYDQHLIVPFYQSLILLNLNVEQHNFEKILISLSETGFKELSEKRIPEKDIFLPDKNGNETLFSDFDSNFNLEKYCTALIKNFYAH